MYSSFEKPLRRLSKSGSGERDSGRTIVVVNFLTTISKHIIRQKQKGSPILIK